ncbi:MAG: CinA family protein [Pseudomonadota bacterium]|nr:CinA family protein [Alphaproteobacteria bacterium]MEC7302671.1 CinA family protein [Pseudomonadota bacterium]MEC7537091.1 CinA family protein [Pseudomonadota bacterium]MEC7656492.1 CinA family protein [Pseudomonadota bacterium]MED5359037.1 CinA family protein [Pseudomonadota bacterium]|tara:strand:+ start:1160 stop:1645 length:486 start_codon:yes stop_codon:yes gene_type:complete
MDLTTKTAEIAKILIERGETVAVGESSAGGLVSASLLAVSGASKYFMGGGVIYTHRARKRLMKIDFKDHPGVRSSSEPYASLLAGSVRELLSATWGLAETGAAGPTGNSYGDDAGHTCVAVAGPVTDVRTLETASSDREANMWAFTDEALELFIECLKRAP